jgi:hypothetical protein
MKDSCVIYREALSWSPKGQFRNWGLSGSQRRSIEEEVDRVESLKRFWWHYFVETQCSGVE